MEEKCHIKLRTKTVDRLSRVVQHIRKANWLEKTTLTQSRIATITTPFLRNKIDKKNYKDKILKVAPNIFLSRHVGI